MIDDIRNLIGDVVSGKTKDANLAFTRDQLTVLGDQLMSLEAKVAILEAENADLKVEIVSLEANITELKQKEADLNNEHYEMLAFFKDGEPKSRQEMIRRSGLLADEFRGIITKLIDAGFLRIAQQGFSRGRTRQDVLYRITPAGKAAV